MNYILIIILLSASFLFTVLGLYTKNSLMKVIAGSSFIFLGLITLISGIDVQTGTDIVSDISSNVTQYSNQTAVFTNVHDFYINGFSMLFIIVGIFIFASAVWSQFYSQED